MCVSLKQMFHNSDKQNELTLPLLSALFFLKKTKKHIYFLDI